MNCTGKALAMQQIRVVICALMQKFRVRLKEGWDPRRYEDDFKEYVGANHPEVPVTLEPRW